MSRRPKLSKSVIFGKFRERGNYPEVVANEGVCQELSTIDRMGKWSGREDLNVNPSTQNPPQNSSNNISVALHVALKNGKYCPDLSRIIRLWPTLPPEIKKAIIAIVDLSKGGGNDE